MLIWELYIATVDAAEPTAEQIETIRAALASVATGDDTVTAEDVAHHLIPVNGNRPIVRGDPELLAPVQEAILAAGCAVGFHPNEQGFLAFLASLVGLARGRAELTCEEHFLPFRVTRIDGKPCVGTRDWNVWRVNLCIVKGIVTKADRG